MRFGTFSLSQMPDQSIRVEAFDKGVEQSLRLVASDIMPRLQ
ncbi:MAG: hypothetical protein OXT06_17300 [Rhodospirillaceae bacterium]|nr:hypothetical protein [Rhodospirillaceae bacterium]MDD9914998.1 hypothetical protein [Rhodospirillaceae bacterium]MDD9924817.1 hypothetical protein [Rhodospirillaceae bacterium]